MGNYYFSPSSLIINVGDVVQWKNEGGYHRVDFRQLGNPEEFYGPPSMEYNNYTHTFTIPGTYNYKCSIGSHAANGMIGTITVESSE